MNTKRNVLLVGLILMILLASLFYLAQLKYCDSYGYVQSDYKNLCMNVIDYSETVLEPLSSALFLVPLFLSFSLLTYRMHDNVFRAWWNFARWFVPVIIVVTFLLNNKSGGGGYLGMDTMFDGLIYGILYGILIVVSLVKIVHAHKQNKRTKKETQQYA